MGEDLIWVTSKIKQFLERSPYVLDYSDYCYGEKPSLVYKKFIITVENENMITLGIQPTIMAEMEINELKDKLLQLIDNVEVKML